MKRITTKTAQTLKGGGAANNSTVAGPVSGTPSDSTKCTTLGGANFDGVWILKPGGIWYCAG